MGAFFKTLFGDGPNVAIVAALLAIEAVLVHTGHGLEAMILVPLLTLGAAAWLAVN